MALKGYGGHIKYRIAERSRKSPNSGYGCAIFLIVLVGLGFLMLFSR